MSNTMISMHCSELQPSFFDIRIEATCTRAMQDARVARTTTTCTECDFSRPRDETQDVSLFRLPCMWCWCSRQRIGRETPTQEPTLSILIQSVEQAGGSGRRCFRPDPFHPWEGQHFSHDWRKALVETSSFKTYKSQEQEQEQDTRHKTQETRDKGQETREKRKKKKKKEKREREIEK